MIIFMDSFDHYHPAIGHGAQKGWLSSIDQISWDPGKARTGVGCVDLESGGHGPRRIIGPRVKILVGVACYVGYAGVNAILLQFWSSNGTGFPSYTVKVLADQSIAFYNNTDTFLVVKSVANVVPVGRYFYLEAKIDMTGFAEIRIDGVVMCSFTGNFIFPGGQPANIQYFELDGAGGSNVTRYDDLYILDWSVGPNDDYLAPANSTEGVAIEVFMPVANGAVLEWTPLSGSVPNFAEVNEVPPDDDLSYNFDGNVGDIDNYIFQPNVPINTVIFGAQFNFDARLDNPIGSRSVQPNVNGVGQPQGSEALSIDYVIYPTPFDTNPHTGVAFVPGDFPSTEFGPEVIA